MHYERKGPLLLERFEPETFGERLQLALHRRGMTAAALAAMIHADAANISIYVRDVRVPCIDMMICIADALDISIDWLVGRKPKEADG